MRSWLPRACLPLLVLQLTACSNSHGARRERSDQPAAGQGASASMAAAEHDPAIATEPPDAAMQAPPATIDGAVAQGPVECVADRFPPLPAACPAQLPDPRELAEICTLGRATCRYLLDDGREPPHVGELSCSTDSTNTAVWTIADWPCRHECLGASGAGVVQLDASGCEQRTPLACPLAATEQAEVDQALERLVGAIPGLREALSEDTLTVELENGCARALHTGFNRSPDRLAVLAKVLSGARLICGTSLACGQVAGPSTLAVS